MDGPRAVGAARMRLIRHGDPGAERPGLVDDEGRRRDLSQSGIALDLGDPGLCDQLARLDLASLPEVAEDVRLAAPVERVGKFIGIGLNYRDHALEAGLPIPTEPVIFLKATSAVSGPYDAIVLPPGSRKTDWEVELGLVIGRRASHVGEADALEHIAGYLVVNDVSEREYQNERGGTWDKGKGCDSFGPVGPWLATRDEIADPQALPLWLDLNGAPQQRGCTDQMIFSCAEIVSYVSRFMTLWPGDIITTGTPPGVGLGLKPPRFLAPGDVVTLGIQGLGAQRQEVRPWPYAQEAGPARAAHLPDEPGRDGR